MNFLVRIKHYFRRCVSLPDDESESDSEVELSENSYRRMKLEDIWNRDRFSHDILWKN